MDFVRLLHSAFQSGSLPMGMGEPVNVQLFLCPFIFGKHCFIPSLAVFPKMQIQRITFLVYCQVTIDIWQLQKVFKANDVQR